jgi:flagellar motor switch/type III secretory pathway protein FliN
MQEQGQEPIAESQRMLQEAVAALDVADSNTLADGLEPYRFEDWSHWDTAKTNRCGERLHLGQGKASSIESKPQIDIQSDELRIEIGRLQIAPRDLYELGEDAFLLLDAPRQELADLYVAEHRLAKGEILCLDGRICFRVLELIDPIGDLP